MVSRNRKQKSIPKGLKCRKRLSLDGIVDLISSELSNIKDSRKGSNITYSLSDVIMSAFAMFSIKDPSLLCFEGHTSKDANIKNVFKITKVPSDSQMRVVLDNLEEDSLDFLYKLLMQKIQRGKVLEDYVSVGGTYLISVDGTGFFSSNKLFNKNCTEKKSRNGDITYQQQLLGACLVKPNEKEVFPLCPEAIVKQDGSSKNDCEMNSLKRMIPKVRKAHPKMKFTVIGDALFSKAPVVLLLREYDMEFILGAKPKGNKYLFNRLEDCKEYECEQDGKTHRFKFINNIAVNESNENCKINFFSYEEEDLSTFKIKKFSWVTSHEINTSNVFELMKAGRSRWKIENETFNTLKNQGYNLEHNYGLGKNNLSIIFAKLMILAFFVDQVQQRCCLLFQTALSTGNAKIRLWDKIRNLFSSGFVIFQSMEGILQAIVYGCKDPPQWSLELARS